MDNFIAVEIETVDENWRQYDENDSESEPLLGVGLIPKYIGSSYIGSVIEK